MGKVKITRSDQYPHPTIDCHIIIKPTKLVRHTTTKPIRSTNLKAFFAFSFFILGKSLAPKLKKRIGPVKNKPNQYQNAQFGLSISVSFTWDDYSIRVNSNANLEF